MLVIAKNTSIEKYFDTKRLESVGTPARRPFEAFQSMNSLYICTCVHI